MIREITESDTDKILALADKLKMFDSAGLDQIRDTLVNHEPEESDELWFTAWDADLAGVIYCVPEAMTDGTWNILMLLVDPVYHGKGYGKALMKTIERNLEKQDARLLIVETSGLDTFLDARSFYSKCGYDEEARVRDFYAEGDDKIILSKSLNKRKGVTNQHNSNAV